MRILPYEEKYREDVIRVCLSTGPENALTDSKTGAYIQNMYCNYYIDNEQDNIFVLVDDNDVAQGYILCAPNINRYISNMGKYFKVIKTTGFKNILECASEFIGTCIFSVKYPAHLHIDIMNEYTACGYGSELMKHELNNLKLKGVKGVMLIVGNYNDKAIRFYKRNGFKTVFKTMEASVMGQKLN